MDEGPPAKGSGGTSHTPPLGNRKTQDGGVGQTHSPPYSETPPPPKPTANGRGEREGKDGPSGDADSTGDRSEDGPVELAEPERTKGAEIPPRRGSLPSSPEEEQPPLPSRPEEGRGSSTDVSQGETNAGKEGYLADDNGSATQHSSHVPGKGPHEKQAAEGDPEQRHQGNPLPPEPHTEGTQNKLSDDADLQSGEIAGQPHATSKTHQVEAQQKQLNGLRLQVALALPAARLESPPRRLTKTPKSPTPQGPQPAHKKVLPLAHRQAAKRKKQRGTQRALQRTPRFPTGTGNGAAVQSKLGGRCDSRRWSGGAGAHRSARLLRTTGSEWPEGGANLQARSGGGSVSERAARSPPFSSFFLCALLRGLSPHFTRHTRSALII
ncbi:hypothetical protein TraAM80_10028, partial [Trypanosoma rangeli]